MRGLMGLVMVVALGACGNELPHPEITSFTVEPGEVAAGGTVTVRVEISDFTLTDDDHHHHDDDHHHDSVPSVDHEGHDHGHDHDAHNNAGHVHVYLNSLQTNPIGQMVTPEAELVIPEDTEPGEHVLIARLHDDAHMIIEPPVLAEADLVVTE